MRLISIGSCQPGMRLGKSIYSEEGLVLLGVHVELTQSMINRLAKYGINHLYVEDPRTDDIVIPDMIEDETRIKSMTVLRSHFRKLMDESSRKRSVNQQHIGRDFRKVMSMIVEDMSKHKDTMIMLMNISVTDHYLYQHSLNVCIYSTMLGISFGYSNEEIMTLGMGALLHDIGKTQIPLAILQKPSKLSEEEFACMKQHTELGYKMLKDEPNIPLLTAHCAFQHHERIDGSGYPRGIIADDIHPYARWIGLVDSYDAMTTHRTYRPAMLPHQAMEELYAGAGSLYDKSKVELFRDKVALYPLGIAVGLNTGETGVVVDINAAFPQRPIVRILQDAGGQELSEPYEIDLSTKLSFMITSVNDVLVEDYK